MPKLSKQQADQCNLASGVAHFNSDSSVPADDISGKTHVKEFLKAVDFAELPNVGAVDA